MVISSITGYAVNIASEITNSLASVSGGESIIFDIALILIISAVLALIARILRQPLIPAYVIAGLLIGPLVFGLVKNVEMIKAFSEIGIAFLLFTAGIEISFKKIKEAGLWKIILVGTLQIIAVIAIAILTRNFFSLSTLQASYIGIILAFGSTMVVVKLLSDRGELVTLHGRLILGILLLQDLVAILAIIFFTTGTLAFAPIGFAFAKLAGIIVFAIIFQYLILNRLFKFAASSTEFLFLTSLAVLFVFVILSYLADVSIVIGAFIAGVSIANSPFKTELESRIIPLRDFFAILFFVALGTQIVFTGISSHINLFIFILASAFIIKPVITAVLLRITGYRQRTSFHTAISLAQLSEFSLIIGMIGISMSVLTNEIFSTVILATIISMSLTSYFIKYKNQLYRIFSIPMKILKILPIKEDLEYHDSKDKTILLIGSHRMGSVLLKKLIKNKEKLLVLDYNPEIISALMEKRVSCIYGDLCSPEILNKIHVDKLKLVISTVPSFEDNLYMIKKIRSRNKTAKIVATAQRISEAEELYNQGADYIITPKMSAGKELLNILKHGNKGLDKAKKEHLKRMKEVHKLLY